MLFRSDNGNGTYSVTYTAGTVAGPVVLTPKLNGTAFTNPLTITILPAAASLTNNVITTTSTSVVAESNDTRVITVKLKDAYGNNLISSGGTLTFASLATGAGSIGTVTDNNNGSYTATYTVGTTVGTVTASPSLGGSALTNTLDFTVTAPASAANSIVTASLASVVANGGVVTFTVNLRNGNNQPLTSSGGTVTFTSSSPDTGNGSITSVVNNGNGSYTATFTGTAAGTVISPR